MKRQPRRNQSAAFKAKVAVAAVKGRALDWPAVRALRRPSQRLLAHVPPRRVSYKALVVFRKSLDIVCPQPQHRDLKEHNWFHGVYSARGRGGDALRVARRMICDSDLVSHAIRSLESKGVTHCVIANVGPKRHLPRVSQLDRLATCLGVSDR
jgi:hypothetical protein